MHLTESNKLMKNLTFLCIIKNATRLYGLRKRKNRKQKDNREGGDRNDAK